MLPAAPALFSTSTCWPRIWLSFSATMRALVSVTPAVANGTISRMGLLG
jgi:hypothetical protein